MKFLDGYGEQAFALLRIVSGLLFLAHGVQKFFNFPVAFPYPLNPMLHAAGTIEIVAGALIAIGLFTRPAAIILIHTMIYSRKTNFCVFFRNKL